MTYEIIRFKKFTLVSFTNNPELSFKLRYNVSDEWANKKAQDKIKEYNNKQGKE